MTFDQTVRLKTELLLDGLTVSERAMDTVGDGGLEKVFWVFEMTPSTHVGTGDGSRPLPNDMLLPWDTYVDVRYSPHSPFLVDFADGALVLRKNGVDVCEVSWPTRPAYYDHLTRSGKPMKKVASMRGSCGLRVCHDNSCHYFKNGEQCKFCNIVPARQRNRDHVVTHKGAEDVYDAVRDAMIDNPVCDHLAFTAGAYADDGLGGLPAIMDRLQPLLALKKFPIVAAITATRNKAETEQLCSMNISSVAFNIEIWDEEIFNRICSGKARRITRERWITALKEARDLLQPARALTSFVVGLESMNTFLDGVEYFSSNGIFPIMSPFVPMVGTAYEGEPPPSGDWVWEAHERATEIIYRNLPEAFNDAIWAGDIGICPSCTTSKLFFDFMRRIVPREVPHPRAVVVAP